MKIKRTLAMLLCLALAITLSFALASCGGGEASDGTGGGNINPAPAPTPTEDLVLIEGGVAKFQFVFAADVSDQVKTLANNTIKTINKILDDDAKIVTETENNAQDVEIIIGTPKHRGDAYAIDYHYLGPEGYAVKVVGTKVLVLFGSDNALGSALDHMKATLFGVTSKTKEFKDVIASADKLIESKQEFTLVSATIAGNDLDDYKLVYNTEEGRIALTTIQTNLYKNTGRWLEVISEGETKPADKIIYFNYLGKNSEKTTPNGYRAYIDGNNLVFEGEFADKFYTEAVSVINAKFTNFKGTASAIEASYSVSDIDHRNIYYSQYGAKGNGTTNDFAAIKKCHEDANEYGHIVHADEGKTYYIGKTGGETIPVKTDTYWHGATFIFDDSIITVCPCGTCSECVERGTSIFSVLPDRKVTSAEASAALAALKAALPLNGGYGESDNTVKIANWPLEYTALVYIGSSERKVFIREGGNSGGNADSGDSMCEILLIHPDGTIDASTPLTYDYTSISWASVFPVDDTPIVIDGGGALIQNIANRPGEDEKSNYNAFARNIEVSRSNVTIRNFDHRLLDEQEYRGPYAGILCVRFNNNTTYENITLQKHKGRYCQNTTMQGTYEIGGSYANNIKYINVDAINFFCDGADDDYGSYDGKTYEPGEVAYRGIMGTNYCRNFYFNECILHSFDAHKGLGNLTIENSTFEHINLIGSGKAAIKNSTVYIDGRQTVFNLRADYGSTWRGDIEIDNVVMKYSKSFSETYRRFSVIDVTYDTNQDFDAVLNPEYDSSDPSSQKYITGDGCTNYLPISIKIKGLSLVKYTYVYVSPSEIIETYHNTDEKIYLFSDSIQAHKIQTSALTGSSDISKFEKDGGGAKKNRYIGTQYLEISDSYEIVLVQTPQFKDMTYILDGVKQENWYTGAEK